MLINFLVKELVHTLDIIDSLGGNVYMNINTSDEMNIDNQLTTDDLNKSLLFKELITIIFKLVMDNDYVFILSELSRYNIAINYIKKNMDNGIINLNCDICYITNNNKILKFNFNANAIFDDVTNFGG